MVRRPGSRWSRISNRDRASATIDNFTNVNGMLFFHAQRDGLVMSNGTLAGTVYVKEIAVMSART